jgi:hypothetical protein
MKDDCLPTSETPVRRAPWNKGKLIGAKPAEARKCAELCSGNVRHTWRSDAGLLWRSSSLAAR